MINDELVKLKDAKHNIRLAIERKNPIFTADIPFIDYHKYIKSIGDMSIYNTAGLLDYVEDRVLFYEVQNITKIREYAFRRYTCLQKLYLNTEVKVELMNVNAFEGTNAVVILVPENLLAEYQADATWTSLGYEIKAFTEDERSSEEMYIIQHINDVQYVPWIETKNISEIIKDFRN